MLPNEKLIPMEKSTDGTLGFIKYESIDFVSMLANEKTDSEEGC